MPHFDSDQARTTNRKQRAAILSVVLLLFLVFFILAPVVPRSVSSSSTIALGGGCLGGTRLSDETITNVTVYTSPSFATFGGYGLVYVPTHSIYVDGIPTSGFFVWFTTVPTVELCN